MEVYVDFSCEENSQTAGRTKITVSDFDSTSIRDVKCAIQEAIQAPVCDQQLFYQGQRLTDDNMPLSRLYFREGDCFKVQFLAAADIPGMSKLLDELKKFAEEIAEIAEYVDQDLSVFLLRPLNHDARCPIHELSRFFRSWKCLRSVAQRHFCVQEGGFDAFLKVFKFSRQLYTAGDPENAFKQSDLIMDQLKLNFNQEQLILQLSCLGFLSTFGETPEDRKFLISRNIFPLIVDALLLQPCSSEDAGQTVIARLFDAVNHSAIGCCAALVETDSNIQEEVSKNLPLIDKLIFMIGRCQSAPAGYSLFSSQVASCTLFYVTFNVKSAQPLVDCGAVEKIINITRKLLIDNDGNTPLRYYCCLFLARMRSAPLVTLGRDTCVAIDELIDMFLSKHEPNEISKWEEEYSFVWITMVPLVHLVFAAGKEYYWNKMSGVKGSASQGETSVCGVETCVVTDKKEKSVFPGSTSTLKLGIFSLVHMFSIKENQQLALSENLLPYLVCLSWHLKCDEGEKLKNSLGIFYSFSEPPSLKIAAKSVLALVYGFDIVLKQ